MLRSRSRGWLALFAAAWTTSGVLAAACSDDSADVRTEHDAGFTLDATGAAGLCPTAAPVAGERCVLPEGTTCTFGACGTPIAECRGGAWHYGGNPPPRPLCPEPEPPPSESTCPPCWPSEVTCRYGSCSGPDASTNTAVASCPSGSWVLAFTACPVLDGGADVQDDAGRDAD